MSYFYDSRENQLNGLLCNDDFEGELVELTELDEAELAGARLLMNWINEHNNACGPGPTEPIPNLVSTDELVKKIRKDYERVCEETQPLLDAFEESKYIDPDVWNLIIDV